MSDGFIAWPKVRQIVSDWFDGALGDRFVIADMGPIGFQTASPPLVQGLLAGEPMVDPLLYEENAYDCEDYAMAARTLVAFKMRRVAPPPHRPLAFGVLFSTLHALNIGIDSAERPYLYDPKQRAVWLKDSPMGAFEDFLPTGWLQPEAINYVLI